MSRCFPFPPPGYESTAGNGSVELLATKEKHKEKKHKKERNRDKRDDQEKKDNDRSKDNHKEKKYRKEKHKDRKKDKEKDKGEGKISEERKFEELIDGHHKIKPGVSSHRVEMKDSNFTEELGRRIVDGEEATTSSMAENFTWSAQRRSEDTGTADAMGKRRFRGTGAVPNPISTLERRNKEMGQPKKTFAGSVQKILGMQSLTEMEKERGTCTNMVANPNGTEKRKNDGVGSTMDKSLNSMQKRSKSICITIMEAESDPDKVSNTTSTMVPNIIGTKQRNNHGKGRPVDNAVCIADICIATALEKGGGKNNTVSYPIGPLQGGNEGIDHPTENVILSVSGGSEEDACKSIHMAANLISTERRRNNGMEGSVGKDSNSSVEGKKTRVRRADFKGDNHKDGGQSVKKSNGKDKDIHKEKDKMREHGEHKHKKKDDKPRDRKNDRLDSRIKSLAAEKDNAEDIIAGGNINKRKHTKMHGVLHEDDARANKILRSSNLHLKNGRLLEPCRIARFSISPEARNNVVAQMPENKEHTINGIPKAQPSSDYLRSPVAVDISEHNIPLKPPRPDSKNVFLLENDARKTSVSSNLFSLENGMEPSYVTRLSISHGDMNDIITGVLENKEHKLNGITESWPSLVDLKSPDAIDISKNNVTVKPSYPDSKINGFLHEENARPNKILRTTISSNFPLENGRIQEPYMITKLSISPGVMNKIIARIPENKKQKINGMKESRLLSLDLRSPVAVDTNKDRVILKPPHLDAKSLNQIYSVPKMEEWPEFDEQEWLFCSDNQLKETTTFDAEETSNVWAKAMHIESADVIALPYVTPF